MDPNLSAFKVAKLTLISVGMLEASVPPAPSRRSFTGYLQWKKLDFSILHCLRAYVIVTREFRIMAFSRKAGNLDSRTLVLLQ